MLLIILGTIYCLVELGIIGMFVGAMILASGQELLIAWLNYGYEEAVPEVVA